MEMKAPRVKKVTITQFMTPEGSFKSCVSHWNQGKDGHVFLRPTFGILSFDFIFKMLICACEGARGLNVDSAWFVQE